MPPLSEIAEQEINQLRAEGINPTLAEIVWLNDLGDAVENQPGVVNRIYAGVPVVCGNVTLWPLTIQAGEWFDLHACRLFQTERMRLYSLGFALNFGRRAFFPKPSTTAQGASSTSFAELVEYNIAREVVNNWALHCGCTAAELEAAIAQLMPQIKSPHELPAPEDDNSIDLITELTAGTGHDREYWLAQTSSFAWKCLAAVYRQAAISAGGGKDESDDMQYRAAMFDFMNAVKKIRNAHGQ